MADMRQQPEVYHRQRSHLSIQEVRKAATIAVGVVVEAITDRIYIHMVPVAVRLHVYMPAAEATAMVDDGHRRQVTDRPGHRTVAVPEQCIMGMVVMAEVSNIIHRKMSRTSQFQHREQ